MVGNAEYYYFGVVAAGEGTFRVGPIVLGLALLVAGCCPPTALVAVSMLRRFRRVFVNREIAERVDCFALLPRLDDKLFAEFAIGESGQAKHARRVRCRSIARELTRQVVQK